MSPVFTTRAEDIREGMIESILMTVAASVVGIAVSIPIGPGAARNIGPYPVYLICRSIVTISRALQEINEVQVEAITATEASGWQVIVYGITPQIMPAFVDIAVFRWDINIRESSVLGLVGAGGVGLQLSASLNVLAWPQVTLVLLVILVAVVIGEWVSATVRGAII